MNALTKDPVCGMEVKPHQNEIVYMGVEYAFCSEQCQKQFLKDPHLYIGQPVQEAHEQPGGAVVKIRRMHLDSSLPPEHAETLVVALMQLSGINRVLAKDDRLEIGYDSLQVTAEQIELKLVDVGNRIGGGWAERLRQGFIHFLEECQIGNHSEKG